ncbi:ECF transporter S component [Angustibacter luteus]|uniref:ECF transporter S component n=1 Tax=Angustibacter luteus TaxID=658456 RepID=A0ABW1JFA0_9ACTN
MTAPSKVVQLPTSDRTPRTPPRIAWAVAAVGVVLGLAIWLIGLPDDVTWFGSTMSDLSLPAGLIVALLFGWIGFSLASARASWRVVDLVVAGVLGVAGGLLFAVWNANYAVISGPLGATPAIALLGGAWLLPGVLGALVIRRPGAAVLVEVVAAVVEGLIGSQWGFTVVWYGLLEGLGAEIVFALLLYRRFGLPTAMLSGAVAGLIIAPVDLVLSYAAQTAGWKLGYVVCLVISGAVLAGVGAWAITRGLARTGALAPLASGRSARRV